MTDDIKLIKNKLTREIKARHQAEKLLEEKSEELYDTLFNISQSEALLQSALSNMIEGFLLTDQNSKILLVNKQLKLIYPQYAPYMHAGLNIQDYFHIFVNHPAYLNMIDDGHSHCSFEIQLESSQVIAVLVNRSEKDIIISTHKDISQEKAIISEQQQTIVKLLQAQKMEHIGKMASSVAHDFNNIIAAIKGYASFLKEDIPNDPNLHNSVDKIQEASNRAEDMVKNILEFSKHAKPQLKKIELMSLIDETITLIKPNIPKHIDINVNLSNKPCYINGNNSQLAQVIINFINNSVNATGDKKCTFNVDYQYYDQIDLNQPNYQILQFMPKNSHHVIAGLHVFKSKCIKINIYDNGPGMEKNIIDNIFEMFFTTKNSNQGTGLGMYSVATTVIDHNGGIKIYSKPNFGTYIELILPLIKPDSRSKVLTSQVKKINTLNNTRKPKYNECKKYSSRILIIDDNQEVGHLISQTLLRHNIKSLFIDSAKSGLQKILDEPKRWNLIICDQKMPDLLGLQLLKRIRAKNIQTPFILTSGFINEYASDPSIKYVDQLLPKPINKDLLLNSVNLLTK